MTRKSKKQWLFSTESTLSYLLTISSFCLLLVVGSGCAKDSRIPFKVLEGSSVITLEKDQPLTSNHPRGKFLSDEVLEEIFQQ